MNSPAIDSSLTQVRVTDGFVNWARLHPEAIALTVNGDRLTYGELLQASLGTGLQAGSPWAMGDRVGILWPNSIEFWSAFLGVVLAGGVAIVLDPQWSLAQVRSLLAAWQPKAMIAAPAWAQQLPENSIALIQPLSAQKNWKLAERADALLNRSIDLISPDAPFYIGFTSGTTGQPKGIVRSHRAWVASLAASQLAFGIQPSDRVLVPGAMAHSLSLYASLESLNAGAALHLCPQFAAQFFQPAIATATVLIGVPALLQAIARSQPAAPHLRLIITGGEKLAPAARHRLAIAFPQARILEYFGASELGFISLSDAHSPIASVGKAFPMVQLRIRRADGSWADQGEVGAIVVNSPMVSLSTGGPCSWASAGDRGWLDAEGYLYLAGREQLAINSGGIKTDPAIVEAALQALPEIQAAAVFGIADPQRGERIAAAIQWHDRPLSPSQLRRSLLPHLDRRHHPRQIYSVAQLPYTANGKLDRASLAKQFTESSRRSNV